jgi:hypothetical protein
VPADHSLDALWQSLRLPPGGETFDPASVQDLPAPARRYFQHTLAPGTPLARSVVLTMHGRIGLRPGGVKSPFTARQILPSVSPRPSFPAPGPAGSRAGKK